MAAVAHAHQLGVDHLDRADVDTPGRVLGDDQRGLARQFPANDELLLVAARHGGCERAGTADLDLVALDQRLREPHHRGAIEKGAARERADVVAPGVGVFRHRRAQRKPDALPVLGDVAEAGQPARADVERLDPPSCQFDRSAGHRPQPGDRLDQIGLAIAADAGDADDLTLPDIESERSDLRAGAGDAQVLHRQDDRSRLACDRPNRRRQFATDDLAGNAILGGLRQRQRGDQLAAAHDGHVIGNLHDLVELVGDDDDRFAGRREAAQDREQTVLLLRRQDRRRLVQDEHGGVAVEHFEDLDDLLLADRETAHPGVEVDGDAVLVEAAG